MTKEEYLDSHPDDYFNDDTPPKIYCDCCGELIVGEYYHICGKDYCVDCVEERETDEQY